MAYVKVAVREAQANFALFIVGAIVTFVLLSSGIHELKGILGIDSLQVKLYKDFQLKNDNNIPLEMKEGYTAWLNDIKVEQLQKKIEEGIK